MQVAIYVSEEMKQIAAFKDEQLAMTYFSQRMEGVGLKCEWKLKTEGCWETTEDSEAEAKVFLLEVTEKL